MKTIYSFLFVSVLSAICVCSYAETHRTSTAADAQAKLQRGALTYFTDMELRNQDGEVQHFYSDLLKNKVVIINSFFSTCKGVCPVTMGHMAKIQERFSDRMGKDLHIISVTVDPETDTPPKMKAFAKKIGAGPGWHLVTGDAENVRAALLKFNHLVGDKEAHKNTVIIGKESTGMWKETFLLLKPETLDTIINQVLDDELPAKQSAVNNQNSDNAS